jgi:iron complex outermembrane receptor protein
LGVATDHIDPAQLRGLGTDQVLVLVNGKRFHQTSLVNVNGTANKGTTGTDLNAIPAGAIDHIEILRDGASAQYGSDAIAGVINIVLKKAKAFTFTSSFGENLTGYDKNYGWNKLYPSNPLPDKINVADDKNFQLGINYGAPLKKGYLNLTAEYLRRGYVNRTGLYYGQLWSAVNGKDMSDSINAAKGLTRNNFEMRIGTSQITSAGGVLNFAYPVGKRFEVYAFGVVNSKQGVGAGLYIYPYKLAAAGGSLVFSNSYNADAASQTLLSLYPNGFSPQIKSKIITYSVTGGIRGNISGWKTDLSQTYGYNSYTYLVSNSVNLTQAYLTSPENLQTNFNAGKTAVYQSVTNIDFSKNHPVLQGLNTAFGAELRVDGYSIDAGEFASYGNFTKDSSLAAIQGAQAFAGFLPANAGSWNRKAFALYSDNELEITKKLLATAALRYEHFSDFGSAFNFKFSGRYKVADWLAFRGAASSGFRAPSMAQEHYSKVTTLFIPPAGGGALVQAQSGVFTNNSDIAQAIGIPKLKQETSHSYSLGATATILTGLDFTIDAYQINIKNRIILSNNISGASNAQLAAILAPYGAQVASFFTNAIDTRSRGIEAVLNYTRHFGKNHLLNISFSHATNYNKVKRNADGTFAIHASQLLESLNLVSRYFNRADASRIESYSPKTKDILTTQYRYKNFGTLLSVVYFGSVTNLADSTGAAKALATNTSGGNYAINAYNNNKLDILDQTFKGKILTDLSFNYFINKTATITLGVNNLFDVYPDKLLNSGNSNNGVFTYFRAVSQFGYNGRYVFGKIAIRLN